MAEADARATRREDGRAVGVLRDRRLHRGLVVALGCLLLADCSSSVSRRDARLGVAASPKLIADGQPVPKGGGRRWTGSPYVVAGRVYRPLQDPRGYHADGLASWYGAAFRGRLTSNGEIFDGAALSAAHPTLPLPSYLRVSNLQNGRSVVVRVNDRGPFERGRLLDVSKMTAQILGFQRNGTAPVHVDYVGPASLAGSSDRELLATYEVHGHGAPLPADVQLAALPAPPRAVPRAPVLAAIPPFRAAPLRAEAPEPVLAARVPLPAPPPRGYLAEPQRPPAAEPMRLARADTIVRDADDGIGDFVADNRIAEPMPRPRRLAYAPPPAFPVAPRRDPGGLTPQDEGTTPSATSHVRRDFSSFREPAPVLRSSFSGTDVASADLSPLH